MGLFHRVRAKAVWVAGAPAGIGREQALRLSVLERHHLAVVIAGGMPGGVHPVSSPILQQHE